MSKQDLQFQIDQLRKDKMIYVLESIATSIVAVISAFLLSTISWVTNGIIVFIVLALSFIYWLYTMVGNFWRLQQIKKLEKQLREE